MTKAAPVKKPQAPTGVTAGELPDSPRTKAAQTAANTRWALTKAADDELLEYFKTLPLEDALPLIDKMRQNMETVCKLVQSRIDAEQNNIRCTWCKGERKGQQWRMNKVVRNPVTRQLENVYYCSDVCITLYNQKHQGVAAIPDRGMSRGTSLVGRTGESLKAPK